ncbi:MAG: carboxypeptidase-like regulatory domain-containing protein [Bacteroidetes bacterium]|nr:carboxypeptidase-like regulatory domain-containing protein [Bacteroidota bacterium]
MLLLQYNIIFNRSLLFVVLFIAFPILLNSQNITITGSVKDESTSEPIQFSNVFLKNAHKGTTTDETGKFSIQSSIPFDTLIITYIGYKTDTILLNKEINQQYNVYLIPNNFDLNEVVIKPKEEPAKVLMRKVIENKN